MCDEQPRKLDMIFEHPEVIRLFIATKNSGYDINDIDLKVNIYDCLPDKYMTLGLSGIRIGRVFYNKLIKEVNLKYERDQKINDILNAN